MNQVKETLVGFLMGLGLYAVCVEGIGIVFSDDRLTYTLGLLFGAAIAVLLFLHMAKTLNHALDLSPEQATKYVRKQSFLRLAVMLAVMILGLLVPVIGFIPLVLGLLGLKLGALLAPFFLKRLYPDSFITKEDSGEAENPAE